MSSDSAYTGKTGATLSHDLWGAADTLLTTYLPSKVIVLDPSGATDFRLESHSRVLGFL